MWFPEIGRIVASASGSDDEATTSADPARLVEAFPDGVTIDDPRSGHVEGRAAIETFRDRAEAWLRDRSGRVEIIATTVGPGRAVGEFNVELTEAGRTFVLPVAVVVELDPHRRALAIRIYHSQWPLLGHHVRRPPLLARDPAARESDIVGEYQAALAAGDVERIVATFEPDGCFREPAGPQYMVCGTDAIRELMTRFFSAGGGITLEHCTVTEDGVRTALEFNAVKWGSVDMPHQAGVAIYERGGTGHLQAARIYDDVEGPVEE